MSAFVGAQGYERYSSAQQLERSVFTAPVPSAAPDTLSRILYIPPFEQVLGSRFQIGEISQEYKHAIAHSPLEGADVIGEPLMGSRLYMTRLETLRGPSAERNDQSQYQIAFEKGHDGCQEVTLLAANAGQEQRATVVLSESTESFQIKTGQKTIDVVVSFPQSDLTVAGASAKLPFLSFSLGNDTPKLQWQIHPEQTGLSRYTLVEFGDSSAADGKALPDARVVKAIFQQFGDCSAIVNGKSNGVLLLPSQAQVGQDAAPEMVVVASLIGLLHIGRVLSRETLASGTKSQHKRKESSSFWQTISNVFRG